MATDRPVCAHRGRSAAVPRRVTLASPSRRTRSRQRTPERAKGLAPFGVQYADGDGDLCTRAVPHLLDVLALGEGSPVKLRIERQIATRAMRAKQKLLEEATVLRQLHDPLSPRKSKRDVHMVTPPPHGEALQGLKRDITPLQHDYHDVMAKQLQQSATVDLVSPQRAVSPPAKRPRHGTDTTASLASPSAPCAGDCWRSPTPKFNLAQIRAARMPKTDGTEAFGALCDACFTELNPGELWYHVHGSCKDLCLTCWFPLEKHEKQEFQVVYNPECLASDKEDYRVTLNAATLTARRAADEARCRASAPSRDVPLSEEPDFDPSAVIRRRRSAAETGAARQAILAGDFLADRCDFLDGRTVFYALGSYRYGRNGDILKYNFNDLRSDLKLGRIELVDAMPSRAAPLTSRATSSPSSVELAQSRATSSPSSVELARSPTSAQPAASRLGRATSAEAPPPRDDPPLAQSSTRMAASKPGQTVDAEAPRPLDAPAVAQSPSSMAASKPGRATGAEAPPPCDAPPLAQPPSRAAMSHIRKEQEALMAQRTAVDEASAAAERTASREELQEMRWHDLKAICGDLCIPQRGTKSEMIDSIMCARLCHAPPLVQSPSSIGASQRGRAASAEAPPPHDAPAVAQSSTRMAASKPRRVTSAEAPPPRDTASVAQSPSRMAASQLGREVSTEAPPPCNAPGPVESTLRMAAVTRQREALEKQEARLRLLHEASARDALRKLRKLPQYDHRAWLQHSEYSTQQLETLRSRRDWLRSFEAFLRDESLCCTWFGKQPTKVNVRQIMAGLTKLTSGSGVLHPAAKVHFRGDRPLTFDEDLGAVVHAQKSWFAIHGKDASNGWAIRYPVSKLLMYQRYVACGGDYQTLLRGAEH